MLLDGVVLVLALVLGWWSGMCRPHMLYCSMWPALILHCLGGSRSCKVAAAAVPQGTAAMHAAWLQFCERWCVTAWGHSPSERILFML